MSITKVVLIVERGEAFMNVQTNALRKTGDDILAKSKTFGNQIKQFQNIIERIDKAWDGSDSVKYINILKEKYVVGLNDLKDTLEEYGKYLKNVPEAYQILDEIFSSKSIDV